MAFEAVAILANELDALQQAGQSQGDPVLRQRVFDFIKSVCDEADKAFGDIDSVLAQISSLPSGIYEAKVLSLHEDLVGTYSRDKFKKVQKICDRLDELGRHFDQQIKPQLGTYHVQRGSQLFWLLEKHEGAFIQTIESALHSLSAQLTAYRTGADILPIRQAAATVQMELRNAVGEMRRIRVAVEAMDPEGARSLLDWKEDIDEPSVIGSSKLSANSDIIGEDVAHLKKSINTYKRRLRKLEEQKAHYGASVDPSITIEIEDIKEEVSKLQTELNKLESK